MVSLTNKYELRDYLIKNVLEQSHCDAFKETFCQFVGLIEQSNISEYSDQQPVYLNCAIAGLVEQNYDCIKDSLFRLLKQAPKIELTPSPWSNNVLCIMSIKWCVDKLKDEDLHARFEKWTQGFLPDLKENDRISIFEKDIIDYILINKDVGFSSAAVPLFLHYSNAQPITDQKYLYDLIKRFLNEFNTLSEIHETLPTAIVALFIYVFNKINLEPNVIPPTGWSLDNLIQLLKNIRLGLSHWTWENTAKTRGKDAQPIKWRIENEYHVQNLLYVLLKPLFPDLKSEVSIKNIGEKQPRMDFYLPSLHTIIEVKYRKDTKKTFQDFTGELAEDRTLYQSDSRYEDAKLVAFLWDQTSATERHDAFEKGVIDLGYDGCIVINSPSPMRLPCSS